MSTFYSLFDLCDGERVAMRATRFVKQKSMLFTFVGWCKRCTQEHTIERRAPAGSFKTTQADARWDATIQGTSIRLKMPYSMSSMPRTEFTIGTVRFQMLPNQVCRALDPIPASWFVDLSKDVVESTEEPELDLL